MKDFKKNLKSFSIIYNKQIRHTTSTKPVIEQEKFSTINYLLKERLLLNENVGDQFDRKD